jgi:hypothetical protein
MTPAGDAVLDYWREHREQFRQSENQRAVLTNIGSRARLAADSMLGVHRCFPITPPPRS